jgi:hypothetical protein
MRINVQEVKDYKDLLIPDGNYQVSVIGAEDKTSDYGEFIELTFKIEDTIPSGQPFAEDELDPVAEGTIISTRIYGLKDNAEPWQIKSFMKTMHGYLDYFDIDPMDDENITAEDFEGRLGGLYIKQEPMVKKDPDSKLIHRVKWPVAVV